MELIRSIGRAFARLFGRGEAHRRHQEIIQLAQQVRIYPENERLILRLAECHLRAGDKDRALSAYWHVVDIYKKRSDWQKAAAVLKRISMLAPFEMIARFELAYCYEKLERNREAAQQWEHAGTMNRANDDIEGAIRCFTRALALDPLQRHLAHEISRLRPPPKIVATPVKPAKPNPEATPIRPNLASLGQAQIVEELSNPFLTAPDNPLDPLDLGLDQATTEYAPEDLSTLLDDDFDAETIAVDQLPMFDEEHRPTDTPIDPIIRS